MSIFDLFRSAESQYSRAAGRRDCIPAAEAMDADLQHHDDIEHGGHYDPETMSCKLRDDMETAEKGDKLETSAKSSSAQPKVDHSRAQEIFSEYRHSLLRSDKWLMKNLGIPSSNRNKFDNVMYSLLKGKIDKKEALSRLEKLSDGIPNDAWKPGAKKGASSKSSSGGTPKQMSLAGFSLSLPSGGHGSNPIAKYFHAQGSHQYSRVKHGPTGLYETKRPGGAALAREEDVPGMSAFHKNRPQFLEHGDVPAAIDPQVLKNDFRYTANGSTYPMVGNIDGRNYIVKRGILPEGVRRNADLQDHIRKEVAADRFIRAAGLNAPVCGTFEIPHDRHNGVKIDERKLSDYFAAAKSYKDAKEALDALENDDNATLGQVKRAKKAKEDAKDACKKFEASLGKEKDAYKSELKSRVVNGQLLPADPSRNKELVKVAEYVDGGVSLARSWHQGSAAEKAKIRQQVIDSYPIISFLENVDAFKNDNVLVDSDSRLWFIDNGACFDYRAQGGKKLLDKGNRMATSRDKGAQPWYYERNDPTDFTTGYLGLLYAPDQALLQEILADVDDTELVEAGKKYDFEALAKTLPPDIAPRVASYARKLNEALRNPPKGWLSDEN